MHSSRVKQRQVAHVSIMSFDFHVRFLTYIRLACYIGLAMQQFSSEYSCTLEYDGWFWKIHIWLTVRILFPSEGLF